MSSKTKIENKDRQEIRISVILKKTELQNDLNEMFVEIIKDMAKDAVSGDNNSKDTIIDLMNFRNWTNKDLIIRWSELFSDNYFAKNPKVSDLLFWDDLANNSYEKEWITSKDNYTFLADMIKKASEVVAK